ncbi:MAG TPA: hypothetical protein VNJ52_07540 [Patescibacteria group bacterium]|nr:hypothetical protein [Patescibacteria group bacterium]
MDLTGELEQALENVITGQPVDIREDGRRMAGLEGARCEVRPGSKPLLHLWSSERSLVRRVSRVVEATGSRVRLEVERFGPKGVGQLEIMRREWQRPRSRIERESFAERFAGLLKQQFPDETLESLTVSPDLKHSLSGSYARGWMRGGRQAWAVLGAGSSESMATVDGALTFGLIWLDWLRTRGVAPVIAGLRLILPAETGRMAAHRLGAVGKGVAVELYEWREEDPLARRIDPAEAGKLDTWLTPCREIDGILAQTAESGRAIRALDPSAIDSIVVPGTRQVSWRYRGLEFARWSRGEILFGLGRSRAELGEKSWSELRRVVAELAAHRQPRGNHRDPLFRAARERWLETLTRAEITRIDARLDPSQVYCQVPRIPARDRGVIDLLGVTGEGRLAVIALKADEDVQLVLQAVDYWLRVRWHLRQGDFQRYGYFPGHSLQAADPLLYLVAPGLRFHSGTPTVMRYLSAEIPGCRVGLSEDWRSGLRVVERASANE